MLGLELILVYTGSQPEVTLRLPLLSVMAVITYIDKLSPDGAKQINGSIHPIPTHY